MKVLMTGGTGFLGSPLRKRLESKGHAITCLSRIRTGVEGATTFAPVETLSGQPPHEAVINLAGETVVGLWTRAKRHAIYESRVQTTRDLADWIEKSEVKPRVFLSGSAVGIYGDAGDKELTESSDVSQAQGFLAKVCRDWELAASSAAWKGTRTVLLRTGQVLDPSGGYMAKAVPMMRRFPIVILGRPEAFFPWISLEDWLGVAMFALENESIAGPLNLVGPNPVTQHDSTEAFAKKLGKKVRGTVPPWLLKLGAGEFGESITFSQRAVPDKALAHGYAFEQTSLADYLDQAL
jgi:uncharacterized protein (TIGR01777 family)